MKKNGHNHLLRFVFDTTQPTAQMWMEVLNKILKPHGLEAKSFTKKDIVIFGEGMSLPIQLIVENSEAFLPMCHPMKIALKELNNKWPVERFVKLLKNHSKIVGKFHEILNQMDKD